MQLSRNRVKPGLYRGGFLVPGRRADGAVDAGDGAMLARRNQTATWTSSLPRQAPERHTVTGVLRCTSSAMCRPRSRSASQGPAGYSTPKAVSCIGATLCMVEFCSTPVESNRAVPAGGLTPTASVHASGLPALSLDGSFPHDLGQPVEGAMDRPRHTRLSHRFCDSWSADRRSARSDGRLPCASSFKFGFLPLSASAWNTSIVAV